MAASNVLLNTAQVSKILNITLNNVQRLNKEGYLAVNEITDLKNGKMYLYSNKQVDSLIPLIPRIKKHWQQNDDYIHGASKLARQRNKRHQSYQHKLGLKKTFLENIAFLPEYRQKILRSSYFLFHLNHYAKTGNYYLYDLKELVLYAFVQYYHKNNDILQISFTQGNNKTILCPSCKARAKDQNLSYIEYLDNNGGCSKCTKQYNYYSLYEFLIDDCDYYFCFHIPYYSAKKWFKNAGITIVEKTNMQQEGATAFGRTIYESEARAVELVEVINELQYFISEFGIEPLFETYFPM
ncbi:MAG: hypothetical protein K9L17_02195 [Clostridiales bacterium]|nr:hypothetical protein [Clostridiales bacterium]MCF8021495.1 hypothetical protein [Clostridiales bacterium]